MKGLFNEIISTDLQINYVLTHKLNQDLLEDAFSVMRKIGAYNDHLYPVDAKRRLKLLLFSWAGRSTGISSVEQESEDGFLTRKMLKSLIDCGQSESPITDIPLHESITEIQVLTFENTEEVYTSMGIRLRTQYGSL